MPSDVDVALARWFERANERDGALASGTVVATLDDDDDIDEGRTRRGKRRRGLFGKTRGGGPNDVVATVSVRGGLKTTRGDDDANGAQRELANENEEWALSVVLMRERAKGKASRYAPFVESLYEHTPASAVAVSEDAREALEAYSAGETIKAADADVERGWISARKTFEKFPTIFSSNFFTFEAFKEALSIVQANAFVAEHVQEANGETKTYRALVPIAHLIPHSTRSTVPCVRIENDEFVIKVDPYEEMSEMTCSHGNYSDAETFARFSSSAHYSEAANPANMIKLAFPKADAMIEHIKHCGLASNIGINAAGATPELMCALRLGSANATELRKITKSPQTVQSLRTTSVSERSEIAVYDVLFATITSLLNAYPTSDAEDRLLLTSPQLKLKDDVPQAILVRYNEKRLAVDALNKIQYQGRKHLGHVLFDEHFSRIEGLSGGGAKNVNDRRREEL